MAVTVGFTKLYDGYVVFRKLSGLPRNKNSRRLYFKFLQRDEEISLNTALLTDEAAAKLEWITGPHAYTMFRAWEARNEEAKHK